VGFSNPRPAQSLGLVVSYRQDDAAQESLDYHPPADTQFYKFTALTDSPLHCRNTLSK